MGINKSYMRIIILLLLSVFTINSNATFTLKTEEKEAAHFNCVSYIYGMNGYELSYEDAFEWCSKSAGLGVPSSQTLLAELYLKGNGVEKDLTEAISLYRKAAKQGHPHAQFMMFIVIYIERYEESTDVEMEEAMHYLKAAKDSGYPKAVDIYHEFFGSQ